MEIDIFKPLGFVLIAIFLSKKLKEISVKTILSTALLAFLSNLSKLRSLEQIKTDILTKDGFLHYCISSAITMAIAIIILLIYGFIKKRNTYE